MSLSNGILFWVGLNYGLTEVKHMFVLGLVGLELGLYSSISPPLLMNFWLAELPPSISLSKSLVGLTLLTVDFYSGSLSVVLGGTLKVP